MTWYRKVLIKNKNEIIRSAIVSVVITFLFSLWYFSIGKPFEWRAISPIEQPSLLYREFYSAFAFVTIGAFLYYVVRLWQILYFIFVEMLGSRELYNFIKSLVWISLILATYLYIFPAVVDFLNIVISFFYNLAMLFVYLFPSLAVLSIAFVLGNLIFKKFNN